jgi:hypothetical protein
LTKVESAIGGIKEKLQKAFNTQNIVKAASAMT